MSDISQVILNGSTLMDLTADTVTPETVLNGYTFHAADGSLKVGNAQVEDYGFNIVNGLLYCRYYDNSII